MKLIQLDVVPGNVNCKQVNNIYKCTVQCGDLETNGIEINKAVQCVLRITKSNKIDVYKRVLNFLYVSLLHFSLLICIMKKIFVLILMHECTCKVMYKFASSDVRNYLETGS